MKKPEMDAPSLQSKEGHLQTSMELWVDNNNDAPAGNLGPTLLWTCTGSRVSGVSILRNRVMERSKNGRARLQPMDEPSLRSCMLIPHALLTTLLSWMDVVTLFGLSHSLCTTILSSPVPIYGVRGGHLVNCLGMELGRVWTNECPIAYYAMLLLKYSRLLVIWYLPEHSQVPGRSHNSRSVQAGIESLWAACLGRDGER